MTKTLKPTLAAKVDNPAATGNVSSKVLALPASPSGSKNRHTLEVAARPGDNFPALVAKSTMSPEVVGASMMLAYNPDQGLDLNAMVTQFKESAAAVSAGDMSGVEAMLLAQAHSLQAMFSNLAHRAKQQTGMEQLQCITALALRAQNNCRVTLQTLAEVKYPRQVVFAKQANMANGPQQVNNGLVSSPTAGGSAPAIYAHGETGNGQSKLLERVSNGSTQVDTGTAHSAGRGDKTLEPLEIVNGAKNSSRKGRSRA